MGHRNASGWIVDAKTPRQLRDSQYYALVVSVNGATVTVSVDGAALFTWTFARRIIEGVSYGLNKGLIGVRLQSRPRGEYDNVQLRVAAPEATYDGTVDFGRGATAPLGTPTGLGTWTPRAAGSTLAHPRPGPPPLVTGRIVPQALRDHRRGPPAHRHP